MAHLAIAMDLGTSGLRAQALDLSSGEIVSTAITTRHPLPGANVMDHLHFTLELGVRTEAGCIGLEEDVVVTEHGCEFLSTFNRELQMI